MRFTLKAASGQAADHTFRSADDVQQLTDFQARLRTGFASSTLTIERAADVQLSFERCHCRVTYCILTAQVCHVEMCH